jgi:hypothetical protein
LTPFSRWYAQEYDDQADFRVPVVSRMFDAWCAHAAALAAPRDTSPLLEQANPSLSALCARLRELEKDHDPEGWPAVQMKDISALLDVVQQPKGNERG